MKAGAVKADAAKVRAVIASAMKADGEGRCFEGCHAR
jgi:hypothetical protein